MSSSIGCPEVYLNGLSLVVPGADSAADLASGRGVTNPEWFEPKKYLGRRGFKYYSSATRYLLSATRKCLDLGAVQAGDEHVGVVVGSNSSVVEALTYTRDTLGREGASAISPMLAGNLGANCPASQVTVTHEWHAFCLTLTNPLTAGLEALEVGARSIARGRASRVLIGAVEADPQENLGNQGAVAGVLSSKSDVASIRLLELGSARWPARIRVGSSVRTQFERVSRHVAGRSMPWSCLVSANATVEPEGVAGTLQEVGLVLNRVAPVPLAEYGGTLAPMLQLAHLIANYGEGLVVAVNYCNQLAFVYARSASI